MTTNSQQKLFLSPSDDEPINLAKDYCSVCYTLLAESASVVTCNACNEKCHLKNCSGLRHKKAWKSSFVAPCCSVPVAFSKNLTSIAPSNQRYTQRIPGFKIKHLNQQEEPSTKKQKQPKKLWYCSVCKKQIHHASVSVQCNSCLEWAHFKDCSKLAKTRDWNMGYIAPCCRNETEIPAASTLAATQQSLPQQLVASISTVMLSQEQNARACPVCKLFMPPYTRCVQCNDCKKMCHLKCSGLSSKTEWDDIFVAPCCRSKTTTNKTTEDLAEIFEPPTKRSKQHRSYDDENKLSHHTNSQSSIAQDSRKRKLVSITRYFVKSC